MPVKENKNGNIPIINNMGWMIFDKVFMLVLNLLVTVKIANHFGSIGYGNYQYAVNVIAIFEILVTFVDGRVVKKQYKHRDADTIVITATLSRLVFAALLLAFGTAFVFIYRRNYDFTVMFLVLLINSIVVNLRFGMANRFEYILKSKKVVLASDGAAIVGAILQLIAVRFEMSIIAISVIALISSFINLFIIIIQYRIEFCKLKVNLIDYKLLKILIMESAPLAIAASCATIYTKCDSIMLGSMLSVAEVGVYAISIKLISIVQIAIAPIRESVYPKLVGLYNIDKERYEKVYIRISSILTWIYIIGVLFSFIVLPFVFRVLNQEYYNALNVYKIHVLGTFFMYNAALRAGHFTLINKGNILMYAQIMGVVINIVLNIFGIKLLGMYGAALATVITQGFSLMISNLLFGEEGRRIFIWQLKAFNPIRMFN